jgi:hypothetical protein
LPRFDPRHPDTIRYLDGTEEQVDGGDPMNYVQIFTTGPGQIVTEIPGMPLVPIICNPKTI